MYRIFACTASILLFGSSNSFAQAKEKNTNPTEIAAKSAVEDGVPKARDEATDAKEEVEEAIPLTDEDGNPIGSSDLPSNINPPPAPVATNTTSLKKRSYPMEKINRPLTLHRKMLEITYDLPVSVDPFSANNVLGVKYGWNDNLQLGLTYNVGQIDSDGFQAGKAFSVEGRYALKNWLSLQAEIPVNVKPFATSLVLGAPLQFSFFDSFRLEFGEDLLSIKVNKFIPSLQSASENESNALANASNTLLARAILNLSGHLFYQWKPNQVIEGHFGVLRSIDGTSGTKDDPVFLHLGFMHSLSNLFDLKVLLGSDRLDDPFETFFVQGHVAKRF